RSGVGEWQAGAGGRPGRCWSGRHRGAELASGDFKQVGGKLELDKVEQSGGKLEVDDVDRSWVRVNEIKMSTTGRRDGMRD
ncbi:hypothetical protein TorRG33x02_324370, partial [Trema orientale]